MNAELVDMTIVNFCVIEAENECRN